MVMHSNTRLSELRETARAAHLVLWTSAERPDLWTRISSKSGARGAVAGALVINPAALPSNQDEYRTMVVADDLDLPLVDHLLSRALNVLAGDLDSHTNHVGWHIDRDGVRVLLLPTP